MPKTTSTINHTGKPSTLIHLFELIFFILLDEQIQKKNKKITTTNEFSTKKNHSQKHGNHSTVYNPSLNYQRDNLHPFELMKIEEIMRSVKKY